MRRATRARELIVAAAAAAGCSGPPALALDGALAGADAATTPSGDAAQADSRGLDAPILDAGPPDASWITPLDPYGIHVRDVTLAAFGGFVYQGRSSTATSGMGAGAAIGDLDGDGDLDLVLARIDDPSSGDPGGPTALFRNGGVGGGFATFTSDPSFAALTTGRRIHGVALGDYDRDGDLDVFLASEGADCLLENDGAGHFTDVTVAAGVTGGPDDTTVGALFADLNHDGLLDLYVVNVARALPPYPEARGQNFLYLNLGDGRFEDVSVASGTADTASTNVAAAFDLDGTGAVVLYVANDRYFVDGVSSLSEPENLPGDRWYRLAAIDAEGIPSFVDEGGARGIFSGRASMGVAIADLDDDLTPDVYVTDWGENDLYLNPTPGGPLVLADVSAGVGVGDDGMFALVSWGARFLDFDRDGHLELMVANGDVTRAVGCFAYHQLDWYLRRPARGAPFDVITGDVGLPTTTACMPSGIPVTGRGLVTGDLDGDGDEDLVLAGFIEPYRVYENASLRFHHSLRVRLAGTVSAPSATGATLRITRFDGTQAATFAYAGGDIGSHADGLLELGLGADTGVDVAAVLWPSGLTQRIDGLPGFLVDEEIVVTEPVWLTVEPRVVTPAEPPPQLVYVAVGEDGAPLGPAGAGRIVSVTRSDGVGVTVTDAGDGSYTATLPHPGMVRRTVLAITVDGVMLRPRPMVGYR